jgi:FkbM family methyltransferase
MISKIRAHLDTAQIRWRGWQYSRLGKFPVRVHPGDRGFWVDTYFDVWEPETFRRMERVIGPGTSYCDIGAWVGPTAIYASKLGADVTCFEPDPAAYERLLFNLRMNVPGRVKPFNLALGGSDGVRRLAPFAAVLGQSGSSFYAPADKAESAQVLALSWSSSCRLLELPRFDTVKIDIEGGEAELLPEMMPWLRQHRPHLLLATHWGFVPAERQPALELALTELGGIYRTRVDMDTVKKDYPSLFFERP